MTSNRMEFKSHINKHKLIFVLAVYNMVTVIQLKLKNTMYNIIIVEVQLIYLQTFDTTVYVQIFMGCIFYECPLPDNFCDIKFTKP